MDQKICFLGAGSMAEAVIGGLLTFHMATPEQIYVVNLSNRARLEDLSGKYGIHTDIEKKDEYIQEADVIILAVKPPDITRALEAVAGRTRPNQLFISVIAGVSTQRISQLLGHEAAVIRAMPNTSAKVALSATGMAAGAYAHQEHVSLAKQIFESIGIVIVVEEEQIDAITGLSGSGPAYIYYLVESMLLGAQDVGLSKEEAKELIIQTLMGAAQMLKESEEGPAELRKKVTSPNGTTQAGLDVLRSYHLKEAMRECIYQAARRSKELGELMSDSHV